MRQAHPVPQPCMFGRKPAIDSLLQVEAQNPSNISTWLVTQPASGKGVSSGTEAAAQAVQIKAALADVRLACTRMCCLAAAVDALHLQCPLHHGMLRTWHPHIHLCVPVLDPPSVRLPVRLLQQCAWCPCLCSCRVHACTPSSTTPVIPRTLIVPISPFTFCYHLYLNTRSPPARPPSTSLPPSWPLPPRATQMMARLRHGSPSSGTTWRRSQPATCSPTPPHLQVIEPGGGHKVAGCWCGSVPWLVHGSSLLDVFASLLHVLEILDAVAEDWLASLCL